MAGQDKWYFTKEQLMNSPSRKCGIDADKELAYRQQAANLIQDMGQRLHVSQLCINTAIVYMHRFYAFHSFTHFHRNAMAAAALFLAAKMEEQPRKLEYVIKVALLCLHRDGQRFFLDVKSEYYQEQAQDLVFNENVLLQTLGFDVAIDHPHTHVVKTCSLIRASKDLAQTSYFMASNSLHLTTMCLQYKPTVVACFCIHLASKWSNWEIPQSNEGKHWFNYVDKSVTTELLEQLTSEFLHIFDRCPSRLKKKIMSMPNSQGSPSQGASHSGGTSVESSPFDKEPRKIPQEEMDKIEAAKHQPGLFGPSSVTKIDHREYRERQRRAAAAAATAGTSSSGSGGNPNIPSSGGSMQRPPHNWQHPSRDPNISRESSSSRDPSINKDREANSLQHPNIMREYPRDSTNPSTREQSNRDSVAVREHNAIRDISNQRDSLRESNNVRDVSNLRDMPNQREPSNLGDHVSQRDPGNQRELNNSHNVHSQSQDNLRASNDVRGGSSSLRELTVSANVKDSSVVKESIGRDGREHSSNVSNSGLLREQSNMMRDMSGRSVSMPGHNRESSSGRLHNGSTNVPPHQRLSSHPKHLPPSQGVPPESRQRPSQQSNTTRPPQVLPMSQAHPPAPPQRPPSLFSPPEPQQRKASKPPPQAILSISPSPIISIPREARVPAPLSPFSSPNDPEPKMMPEILDNIVKKEDVIPPSTQLVTIPQSLNPVESDVSNNLETDPSLVSSLLKEAIPHRVEKKKKKEKHKHKDKKEKREKHKKSKDKKRESEHLGSHSSNSAIPQSVVSNSNNPSIKITLPREAAANVIPMNSLPDGSPPARLTIKISKERIKMDPPTPQIPPPQQTQQALKIKIPKELVERESRKRPMVGQGGSKEGPTSKSSRNQLSLPHQPTTKVPHYSMGNGQSSYHK